MLGASTRCAGKACRGDRGARRGVSRHAPHGPDANGVANAAVLAFRAVQVRASRRWRCCRVWGRCQRKETAKIRSVKRIIFCKIFLCKFLEEFYKMKAPFYANILVSGWTAKRVLDYDPLPHLTPGNNRAVSRNYPVSYQLRQCASG